MLNRQLLRGSTFTSVYALQHNSCHSLLQICYFYLTDTESVALQSGGVVSDAR